MNYSLKYYPDPGIAFDISKMLFVKLNSEPVWRAAITAVNSPITEVDFIKKNANMLPNPEPEVLLFSCTTSNKTSTFLSTTIVKLVNEDIVNFSIPKLISYFENTNQLLFDLCHFYLGVSYYDPHDIERIIRTTKSIPDKIKILLFGFLMNPTKYVSYLKKSITTYYDYINQNYKPLSNKNLISSEFIDTLFRNTYSPEQQNQLNLSENVICFSLCFTTEDFLLRRFTSTIPYFISTIKTIDKTINCTTSPVTSSLINSALALSDKSRITILSHLISQGQMTLQEISSVLGLSLSATNHHISLLKKAHLITSIRHSRTVLYSYNPNGIHNIYTALQNLEKGGQLR